MDLNSIKDLHKGERCFIVATGPSLNKTNFELIKDEILFGVNTLYRGYDKFGINCQYYGVSDIRVWLDHYKNILKLDCTLFISGFAGYSVVQNQKLYFPRDGDTFAIPEIGRDKFSKDLEQGLYNGQTVVYDIALQACYYMGFDKVYLLGCDCDYTKDHRFDGLQTESLEGGAVGNWERVFNAYRLAKEIYEEDGREIINATVGGQLDIFKRERLEDIV